MPYTILSKRLVGMSRPYHGECNMSSHLFINTRFKKTSTPPFCLTPGIPASWQILLLTIGNQNGPSCLLHQPQVCLLTIHALSAQAAHCSAANTPAIPGFHLPPATTAHSCSASPPAKAEPSFNRLMSVLSLTAIFLQRLLFREAQEKWKGELCYQEYLNLWRMWLPATQMPSEPLIISALRTRLLVPGVYDHFPAVQE